MDPIPLGSQGFSNWISCNFEVILHPGITCIFCDHCSFISQVIGIEDKLNWLVMAIFVNIHRNSTPNMQQRLGFKLHTDHLNSRRIYNKRQWHTLYQSLPSLTAFVLIPSQAYR